MYEVLREFTSDVRAHGIEQLKADWPDLFVTYQYAIEVLKKAKKEF